MQSTASTFGLSQVLKGGKNIAVGDDTAALEEAPAKKDEKKKAPAKKDDAYIATTNKASAMRSFCCPVQ